MSEPTKPNPEEPNVSYGCCLAPVRPLLAMLLLFAAPRPEIDGADTEDAVKSKCLTVLRSGLDSDEFWPAMHAAEALSLAGHGKEVLVALPKRTPADDQQRCGLAREAYRAGDKSKAAVLLEILDKPGSNGHTHAAESLFKISVVGDGKKLRAALAQDGDLKLKLMAAAALTRGGDPATADVVRKYVNDQEQGTRMIAAWVLGQIGGKADIAPLKSQWKKETDPLTTAYFAHALALLGDTDGRDALGENLRSKDPAVRTYAADFAGQIRAPRYRKQLIAMLDDPALDARIRAAEALLMIHTLSRSGGK